MRLLYTAKLSPKGSGLQFPVFPTLWRVGRPRLSTLLTGEKTGDWRPDPNSRVNREDQRGVRPAEAERVRHHVTDLLLARLIRDVVEIALRIGHLVVDRRRDDPCLHDLCCDRRFQSAGRAEEMAGHRFRGADGDFVRLVAEHPLDRERLDFVTDGRR